MRNQTALLCLLLVVITVLVSVGQAGVANTASGPGAGLGRSGPDCRLDVNGVTPTGTPPSPTPTPTPPV